MMVRTVISILLFSSISWAVTLEEALSIAMERSPLLEAKRLSVESAKERRSATKAELYGQLELVGSYTKYNLPRTLTPIVPPISPDVASSDAIGSAGVRYDLLLFSGFAQLRSVEIAEIAANMANLQMGLGRAELKYNVQSIFYKILSLKDGLRSAKLYRKALQRLYEDVKKGVEAGSKARVDLLKVQADLQNADYSVVQTANAIDTLKARLAAVIGVERIDRVEKGGQDESHNRADIAGTFRYKKAEAELRKSAKGVQKARSAYLPKLSLNAYYGDNYGGGEQEELWQIGVALSWPIFDFGLRESKLEEAKLEKEIARLKLENEKLMLASEVVDAKKRIESAEAKLVSVGKEVEFLRKIEAAERIKYEKGASDMYDLLYALAKVQKAESALAEAAYDLRLQRAYLDYVLAGEE